MTLLLTTYEPDFKKLWEFAEALKGPLPFIVQCINEDGEVCSESWILFDPELPEPNNPVGVGGFVAEEPGWFFADAPGMRGWHCGNPKHTQEYSHVHYFTTDHGVRRWYTSKEVEDEQPIIDVQSDPTNT